MVTADRCQLVWPYLTLQKISLKWHFPPFPPKKDPSICLSRLQAHHCLSQTRLRGFISTSGYSSRSFYKQPFETRTDWNCRDALKQTEERARIKKRRFIYFHAANPLRCWMGASDAPNQSKDVFCRCILLSHIFVLRLRQNLLLRIGQHCVVTRFGTISTAGVVYFNHKQSSQAGNVVVR